MPNFIRMEVMFVNVLFRIGMLMVKFIAIQAHIIWTKLHSEGRRNNSYINMLLGYMKVHAHLTEQPWTQTLTENLYHLTYFALLQQLHIFI